jgi:O-methyltransferase involved in polyketide biosynthesis
LLGDRLAAAAIDRVEYDFSRLKLPRSAGITLAARALHLDGWTRAFLAAHPVCTVLHLGCGLDTRVFRIHPNPEVRWYDVDLPEVISLRERLYTERPGYHRVATSVTNPAWLDAIPGDTPVLIVAEGLLMYLPEAEGIALLRRITTRFPSGELLFDAYTPRMLRLVSRLAILKGAKIRLLWGIDDPRDLERAVPGLRLVESVPFLTMPELVSRLGRNPVSHAMYTLLGRTGAYRRLVRHVRYTFGGP